MDAKQYKKLLHKLEEGNLSDQEILLLEKHILSQHMDAGNADEQLLLDRLTEEQSDRIFSHIIHDNRLEKLDVDSITGARKAHVLPFRVAVLAASILLALAINHFLIRNWSIVPTQKSTASSVIRPGGNKAIIYSSTGVVIDLEKVSTDTTMSFDGYTIHKTAGGELEYALLDGAADREIRNTIVTARGGEYRLKLPDGTKVHLNAMSRLSYPLVFGSNKREVSLEGEAYFDVEGQVKQGKKVPFIVLAGNQVLEVLGTEFNINSYQKKIKTTLVEGRVKLSAAGAKPVYLSPNQQSLFDQERGIYQVKEIDPFYDIAWKRQVFAFKHTPIEDVMREIGNWYSVDFEIADDVKDITYTGTISKFEDFGSLLKTLEIMGSVKFNVNNKKVFVCSQ